MDFARDGETDAPKKYFGTSNHAPWTATRCAVWRQRFLLLSRGDSLAIYRGSPGDTSAARRSSWPPSRELTAGPDRVHRDETWRPENRYLWEWIDAQGDGGSIRRERLPGGRRGRTAWPSRPFRSQLAVGPAGVEVDAAGWLDGFRKSESHSRRFLSL